VTITLHDGKTKTGVLSKVVVRIVGYRIGENEPIPPEEIKNIALAGPKKTSK
jgi:hypothetical protein